MDVNATGVFLCVKEQLNHFMATKTKGSIINISSVAGVRPLWLGSAYSRLRYDIYPWG